MRTPVICSWLLTAAAVAQPCTPSWLPGDTIAGASAPVNALALWDPDGAGPEPARVVAGGDFTSIGSTVARGLAIQTGPDTWAELAGGVRGGVSALLPLPDGRLLVGGTYTAGSSSITNLAVLHNGAWGTIEGDSSGGIAGLGVNALTRLNSGDIVVGGRFDTVGPESLPARNLARWNGAAWSAFGSGPDDTVTRLAAGGNVLIAAGSFTQIDGQAASRIARFDGSNWTPVPLPPPAGAEITALLVRADGSFLVGGRFQGEVAPSGASGQLGIAAFNSAAQPEAIEPLGGPVSTLLEFPNGETFAAGVFGSNSTSLTLPSDATILPQAAILRAGRWVPVGNGLLRTGSPVFTINGPRAAVIDLHGSLLLGGRFETTAFRDFAVLRPDNTWAPAAPGTTVLTYSATSTWIDSSALLTGDFTSIGGATSPGIAAFNGLQWAAPIPAPSANPFDRLGLVTHTPTNTSPSTILVTNGGGVRRWNGSAWRTGFTLPALGPSFSIRSVARSSNGAIALGVQSFNLSSSISPIPTVYQLTLPQDPDDPRSAIATALPPYPPQLTTFAFLQVSTDLVHPLNDGSIISAARISNGFSSVWANTIWRWNGSTWSQLGPPFVTSVLTLAQLPDGRIVAAGLFDDPHTLPPAGTVSSVRRVVAWNGTSWQTLGQPLDVSRGNISALLVRPDGSLLAGGAIRFGTGPQAATRLARWTPETNTWLPFADPISPVTQLINLPNNELLATTIGFAGQHPAAGYARLGCPRPLCPANCDASFNPALSPSDFTCFLNNYRAGNPTADCDASGTLSTLDFGCFLAKYRAGCP